VIESVGSVELAERLNALLPAGAGVAAYPVLLQVNVDRDPAKAGFEPEDIPPAVERLDGLERLDFRGLMTVGRLTDDAQAARSTFVALRRLGEALRTSWPRVGSDLSMGMSDDFEAAVEEGATIVRVGRAIFGERPVG
jgi:PLP dependent protein